ncbi:MAG TPA: hypothetical protein VLN26_15750 [Gaiellaceae bacterium]|nr:hypothetical protein [Gaiellaceae bacterium]
MAFPAEPGAPALQIRINFGILAGREATPAEIDDLARALTLVIGDVAIVSEQHHEIGHGHEAVVHQVRVDVDEASLPDDEEELEAVSRRLIETASRWAEGCAAERHAEL